MGAHLDGDAERDQNGYAVALSADGTVVAMGAAWSDGQGRGSETGHARVYEWSGTEWTPKGAVIVGEAQGDRCGHSVALSDDGTVLAVGAETNDGGAANGGHVRVYEWSGTEWTPKGADLDGEIESSRMGRTVALSGDGTIVLAGAYEGNFMGYVRAWRWSGSAWADLGNPVYEQSQGDWFSSSLAASKDGTVFAAGASHRDSFTGQVRVFQLDSATNDWIPLGANIAGEVTSGYAGKSVALSDDASVLAVGAPNPGAWSTGQVRVFEWETGAWVERVSWSGEESNDMLANGLALSGDGARLAATGSSGMPSRVYELVGRIPL